MPPQAGLVLADEVAAPADVFSGEPDVMLFQSVSVQVAIGVKLPPAVGAARLVPVGMPERRGR
jgi:hypothetical protein